MRRLVLFLTLGLLLAPAGAEAQDIRAAARKALEASGLAPERILAVSCTSQWSVVVPVDAGGEALFLA